MGDEIKEILIKDFNEILVKEFCTDWKEKRLYIELLVNSTPFSNLLDYITNLQEENDYLKDIVSNTELSNEIKKADKWSKRELYKINYQRLQVNKKLREENEDLREENKEAHDFDETMKDIKEGLIARINRQECEIHNLKAKLEMYENGVYFSSENDELQQRIDKAIEYIKCGKTFDDIETARIIDKYEKVLLEILQGSDKE